MDLEYSSTVVSWSQAGFGRALSGETPCLYFGQDALVPICVARNERFFKLNRLQMKSVLKDEQGVRLVKGVRPQ